MENPKARGTDIFDDDATKFEHSEIFEDIHYLKTYELLLSLVIRSI